MANIDPLGSHPEAILGPLGPVGPPGEAPRGPHTRLLVSTIPLHNISKTIVKICCQSELDWSKIEKKIKILVNFSHFWTFNTPLLSPRGPFVGPQGS